MGPLFMEIQNLLGGMPRLCYVFWACIHDDCLLTAVEKLLFEHIARHSRLTRLCITANSIWSKVKAWPGQGAHEGQRRKSHLQAASEKVQATAGRVGSQIQDTLSSAVDKAGLSWPTVGRPTAKIPFYICLHAHLPSSIQEFHNCHSCLVCFLPLVEAPDSMVADTCQCLQLGTLLLLAVLTSALTSRLLQPDLTKQKTSALRSSMEQADQRYSSFLKKLQAAEDR